MPTGARARPWKALPPGAMEALAPQLPALAEEIIDAIRAEVPAYARPLEGTFGQAVRRGVEEALSQFAALAGSSEPRREPGRSVYVGLGRGEFREGRTLDALLAAYRVGARVAWRRLAEEGMRAGIATDTLIRLAESIFAYIDELSAESAEGFAREQAERAGEAERRRGALVDLLLRVPPPSEDAIAAAAEAAHWPLPRELAVLVLHADGAGRVPARLPLGAIAVRIEATLVAVVPDPAAPGRRGEIERAVGELPAGLGSAVGPTGAARSHAHAMAALGLADERRADGLHVADEHRAALLCRADPALVADVARDRLAPLAAETASSRARLIATLLAWLRRQGDIPAVARDLHIHPQTVRYRLGRLRELLGDALDDPDARFELEVALRAGAG